MATRVLVVGLDAAEATLLECWSEAGDLPTLAKLSRSGRVISLDDNPIDSLPEAIWHELHTGLHGYDLGRFYVPGQLHTGEAQARPIGAEEIDSSQFFWAFAGDAGCRVAVIDPVHAVKVPDFNGVQLFEYGLHDRHFAVSSEPPEFLAAVRARYGDHPVGYCDDHGASAAGYRSLCADLEAGVAQKEQILCDLLRENSWDLFYATFAESHCVGHQFWHFQDPTHPRHDPHAPPEFRTAMKRIYRRLDQALGRVIEQAGDEAMVMVVASHGMGPYTGGYQLLPEILVRLGMSAESEAVTSRPRRAIRNAYHWLRGRLPLLGGRRPLTGPLVGRRVRAFFGVPVDGLQSHGTRAVALLNNRVGAVRLNLKGRDPDGCVAPGNEATAILTMLREEFARLEDPRSGERIVVNTATPDEVFGPTYHPDVPDLLVVFRTDLGPLEACRSPRVGLVQRPLFKPDKPRTGDHTPQSRLWLTGPGIPHGTARGSTRDLAPTVLQALGVPIPPTMEGSSKLKSGVEIRE